MKNNMIKKYSLLFFLIGFTGLCLWFSEPDNLMFHVILFIVLTVGAIIIVDFDLIHPYFWFSSIFCLYSTSYPVLYHYNYVTNYGYSKELMVIQWIALVVFLLVVTPAKVKKREIAALPESMLASKASINLFCIVLIVASFLISKAGFTHKNDIYSANNVFLVSSFSVAIILTILFMFHIINSKLLKDKFDVKIIMAVSFSVIILTLFSGERDIFFRYFVVLFFILYYFKAAKNVHLLLIIPTFIVALPLSHLYKYFFLTGVASSPEKIDLRILFFQFLNGEFLSASRNLQIIISNESITKGVFKGYTIFNDFVRVFYSTGFSNGHWFNETFFSNVKTTMYGFTLVGQGYINWGYLGVVLIFAFIGLFIRLLYHNSQRNLFFLVVYLYAIPLYMYSIRADIANIISPFIKHLLLGLLTLYILGKLSKLNNENKISTNRKRNLFGQD